MDEFEVAIFPIPGAVSFPLTTVPLHVFEPRYRVLVKDSVRSHRRIAVCHTKKMIRAAKPSQTRIEILSSNQATYQPYPIFAAGLAEIGDITEDGRIFVEIEMDGRYEMVEERQALPYRIVLCRRYDDDPAALAPDDVGELRGLIDQALLKISLKAGDELRDLLASEPWRGQSVEAYSFKIFQFIRFEPDVMQRVLEMRSPQARLRFLSDALGPVSS